MQIQPGCLLKPSIVSYNPEYTGIGTYAYIPIVIKFNMPVEDTEVSKTKSCFKYGENNIKIYNGSNNLSTYFEKPELSEDKTILTLKPKPSELITFLDSNSIVNLDVFVAFGENIFVEQNGIKLHVVQDEAKQIKVCYKRDIETTPPVENSFIVSRKPVDNLTNLSQIEEKDKLSLLTREDFTSNQMFIKNRAGKKIYIYGRYYDLDSGVRSVIVKEKQSHTSLDARVSNNWITHVYTPESTDAEFFDEGNGYTDFCIKADIQSEDGAVLFNVIVCDACGNQSENIKTFSAIKKSSLNIDWDSDYIKFMNARNNTSSSEAISSGYDSEKPFDSSAVDPLLKKFSLWCNFYDGECFSLLYITESDDILCPIGTYTIEANYKHKDGFIKPDEFEVNNNSEAFIYIWDLIMDVNTISNLDIDLHISDDLGNSVSKSFKVPSSDDITFLPEIINQEKKIKLGLNSGELIDKALIVCDEGEKLTKNCSLETAVEMNKNYRFLLHVKNSFWTDISSKTFNFTNDFWNKLDYSVQFEDVDNKYTIKKDTEKNYLDFVINVSNTSWTKFDEIIVEATNIPDYFQQEIFKKNEDSYRIKIKDEAFYNNDINFKIYGKAANGVFSQEETINVPKLSKTETKYDNRAPGISGTANLVGDGSGDSSKNPDYRMFRVTEDESGLQSVSLKYNGNEYNLFRDYGENNYYIAIPLWDMKPNSWNAVQWEAIDNAENIGRGIQYVPLTDASNFYNRFKVENPVSTNTGKYDYILPYSNTSVLVSSDAEVFIHTLITSEPYDVCKDWTEREWETYHKHICTQTLVFSADDHSAQRYNIVFAEGDIKKGDCYCVVAHFADGTMTKSAVFQK